METLQADPAVANSWNSYAYAGNNPVAMYATAEVTTEISAAVVDGQQVLASSHIPHCRQRIVYAAPFESTREVCGGRFVGDDGYSTWSFGDDPDPGVWDEYQSVEPAPGTAWGPWFRPGAGRLEGCYTERVAYQARVQCTQTIADNVNSYVRIPNTYSKSDLDIMVQQGIAIVLLTCEIVSAECNRTQQLCNE